MSTWLNHLALHYETVCLEHANEQLILLFDVDGVILDTRYQIRDLLKEYDHTHQTSFFRNLSLADIGNNANPIIAALKRLSVPASAREDIINWCQDNYWTSQAVAQSPKAYPHIFNVIRWFQIQPNTRVALISGRFEKVRQETLALLHRLGESHRVHFTNDMLYMRPDDSLISLAEHKVNGLLHFQQRGFFPVAMIDSKIQNIQAVAQAVNTELSAGGVLLLHHATASLPDCAYVPPARTAPRIEPIQGNSYELSELITERRLPRDIEMVWHGVNDRENLMSYLMSDIEWAELDVNLDPTGHQLILRHDDFQGRPQQPDEEFLYLDEALSIMQTLDKGVKLDFKVGEDHIERAFTLVEKNAIKPTNLWFNVNLDIFNELWVRHLARTYPEATIQCSIESVLKGVVETAAVKEHLDRVAEWGISRFSISWTYPEFRPLFLQMTEWGFEVNIYGVSGLNAFLQAVLLKPSSVTTDFNFPTWGYYGRGSGHAGIHYTYIKLSDLITA